MVAGAAGDGVLRPAVSGRPLGRVVRVR